MKDHDVTCVHSAHLLGGKSILYYWEESILFPVFCDQLKVQLLYKWHIGIAEPMEPKLFNGEHCRFAQRNFKICFTKDTMHLNLAQKES